MQTMAGWTVNRVFIRVVRLVAVVAGCTALCHAALPDAEAHLQAGRHKEAEAAFSEVLAKSPQDVNALLKRSAARQNLRNKEGALADLDLAIKLAPGNALAWRQRGFLRELMLNDVAGALTDYSESIRLSPNDLVSFYGRGRARMKAGDLPGALADLDRVLSLRSDYGTGHTLRASILEKMGRDRDALAAYQAALKIDPKNSTAKKGIEGLAQRGGATPGPASDGGKAATGGAAPAAAAAKAPSPAKKSSGPPAVAAASPAQPVVPAPIAPASPPRPRVFKLVKVETPPERGSIPKRDFPPECQVTYEGTGPKSGISIRWQQQGRSSSSALRWSVPDVLVPGRPASFRLEGSFREGYLLHSFIRFDQVNAPMAGIRITRNPYSGPDQESDVFDLVLPDIGLAPEELQAGRGGRETTFQLRGEELKSIAQFLPAGSTKMPRDVPLREVRRPLKAWINPNNPGELADLTFTVFYSTENWPVARFVYRADVGGGDDFEFALEPPGRTELRADGRDGMLLKARLKTTSAGTTSAADITGRIAFTAEGADAAWVDLGKPETRDNWRVIAIQASNPNRGRGPARAPESIAIRAESRDGDRRLSGTYVVKIAANPDIDAKPDGVEFLAKSGQSAKVAVAIENAGPDPWRFRAEYAERNRPVARPSLEPAQGRQTTLVLTEAGLDPESGGSASETSVLRIFAEQDGREPLQRDIKIIVGQEGLFATTVGRDPEGNLYRVAADGSGKPTDVDFRVYLYDEKTKRLVNHPELIERLQIECLEPATGVAAQALKVGQLGHRFGGTRAQNDPTGIMRFSLAREIPGDGRIIRCDFKATLPGRDGENFTAIFTLGLVTTSNGPGGANWQAELARCQEIINKFVPSTYHARMQAILDRHKLTLGADGLRTLRDRIWRSAVELTLGEGGTGYANEAAWADHITVTLEWAEWAGDMAFGAVIGTATGPYGATGASMLKTAVISALNAYQEGTSAETWLWENLSTIPGIIEGKIMDPDSFESLGVQSKARAWALYVSYHFCKNLYNGATVVDALKNTAREAGSNLLSTWLGERLRQGGTDAGAGRMAGDEPRAKTPVADVTAAPKAPPSSDPATQAIATADAAGKSGAPASPPARTSAAAEPDAVRRLRRSTVSREGRPYASRDDVLAIMRDPSQVRSLKNAPPEIRAGFANTREAIHRQHDTEVVRFVKENVPDMKYRMVKVMEFRTPGQDGTSLNTDRDYRVCYYAGRDANTGREQWIEIDRRQWEEHSYRTFAQITGGPADSAEAARHWAESHQQLATDKAHAEASPAFSDQAKVWNPQSRRFENAQIVPNIVRVKSGQPGVRLKDPQALGHMYQMKVADAKFKPEAFVQAQKAVKELDAIMDGYLKQKRHVGVLPPPIIDGMTAVLEVNRKLAADPNRRDPKAIADAEKALRASGFQDLKDFMNKLSSQFEALKLVDD